MALDWSSVDKDYSVVVLMDGAQRVGKRDIEKLRNTFPGLLIIFDLRQPQPESTCDIL